MIISKDFPGGNIKVNKIDGYDIYLEQEIRDTMEWWFYFSFKATAEIEGTYTFHFTNKEVISRFGPAISYDGISYGFEKDSYLDHSTFKHHFCLGETIYFAFSYPYTSQNFSWFIASHPLWKEIEMKELTNRNRKQHVYQLGNPNGQVLSLTARHHACEASASYVLEGMMEALEHSPLKDKYLISVIPFVDLDGVEDGDQGKSRAPHDHNRDYIDKPIYSSIRYIKNNYHNRLAYFFDLHCPGKWGGIHEYLSIIEGDETQSDKQKKFSQILQSINNGEIPYDIKHNIEYLAYWNLPSANGRSFFCAEQAKLGFTLEIPFFGELETPYSIKGLNTLGHLLARSIELFDK